MRATLKKSIALSLAALTVCAGLAASTGPAAAWFPPKLIMPFKPFPFFRARARSIITSIPASARGSQRA